MKYTEQIKPISYFKANAAEVIKNLSLKKETMIIPQNGEAKAVIQDAASYEKNLELMALLEILAIGNKQIEDGRIRSAAQVVKRIRQKQRS